MNFKQQSVNVHDFAMVPKADIPRSSFRMQKNYKTTFDAGPLVPILVEEVLPGDTWNCRMTAFARLATPIFPFMDNLHFETFAFFVPNRLSWSNWVKFMGQQDAPGDSISYVIPQIVSPAGGYAIGSVFDYMGLPTIGQVTGGQTVSHSALPLRAYTRIFNDWFRDENLVTSPAIFTGDGPDIYSQYGLVNRGKRHDYFTGCLPFVQKGTSVPLPLGTQAPIKGLGFLNSTANTPVAGATFREVGPGVTRVYAQSVNTSIANTIGVEASSATGATNYPLVYADLSAATAATINQLRQSFQIQKLLERDARGGTRYTEIVRSHFGVMSPDARLQRSEYLGGGHSPINISAVPQTSNTPTVGTPQGNLAAYGTMLANGHGFTQSFTEHGYIIVLCNARADLTYQQGLRRHWSRQTRYDFYFPVFAMLGEQAVLNKEIYATGVTAQDNAVFGYQERWAEYRYNPSEITGLFRSTAAGTLDQWHLAQKFLSLPTLNATFITELPPVDRVVATPTQPDFLLDCFFDLKVARPMPMYSVPGLVDHF